MCSRQILGKDINHHLDSNCTDTTPQASTPRFKHDVSTRASQPSISSLFTPSGKTTRADAHPASEIASTSTTGMAHTRKRSEVDDNGPAAQLGSSKRMRPNRAERLQSAAPLAERLRPNSLDEFVGQPHLTGPGSLLMHLLDSGTTGSMVFWGPPG